MGDYRLLARIGEGGMGVVHLARAPDGSRVACKVLREHVVGDQEARQRLEREVSSLRRVRSPRVAEILDADPFGPRPFVVTRYVPGLSLYHHVAEEGPVRGEDLLHLADGLAQALQDVHAVGVLHRDVKPTNVLMEGRSPVLIDFGLARLAEDPRLTQAGFLLGTPGYLAPEILYGEDATAASDVHAWAATVAFAAAGHPPYGRGPAMAVMDRVRRGEHDLDDVPQALAALLRRGLAPEPGDRPGLAEVRDWVAARRATRGRGAEAEPASEPESWTMPFYPGPGADEAPTAGPVAAVPSPVATPDPTLLPTPPTASVPAPATTRLAVTPEHHDGRDRTDPAADEQATADLPAVPASTSATAGPSAGQQAPVSAGPPATPPATARRPPVTYREAAPYQQPAPLPGRDPDGRGDPPPPVGPPAGSGRVAGRPDERVPWAPLPPGLERRTGRLSRVRDRLQVLGLGAMAGAMLAWAPYAGTIVLLLVVWTLRTVSVTRQRHGRRRTLRGRARWYDVPATTLGLPAYAAMAFFGALSVVLLGALVGLAVGGVGYLTGRPVATCLALGAAGFVPVLWWGPGAGRVRETTRALVRRTGDTELGGWFVVAMSVVGVAVMLGLLVGAGPEWAPASGSPWSLP